MFCVPSQNGLMGFCKAKNGVLHWDLEDSLRLFSFNKKVLKENYYTC